VTNVLSPYWLSSFSCSALWDMESGQLTVTTIDVMSLQDGPDFKPVMSKACDASPKLST